MRCPICGADEIIVDVNSDKLNYNPPSPPMVCLKCEHKADRQEFEGNIADLGEDK